MVLLDVVPVAPAVPHFAAGQGAELLPESWARVRSVAQVEPES